MNLKIISNYLKRNKNAAHNFEKKIVEYENKIHEYEKFNNLKINKNKLEKINLDLEIK